MAVLRALTLPKAFQLVNLVYQFTPQLGNSILASIQRYTVDDPQ